MVFSANPFSLSVPEPAFESWLRDSGYLEVLDQRTSDLHRRSSTNSSSANAAYSNTEGVANSSPVSATVIISKGFFSSISSAIGTLVSLFTLNPFSKLASDDFAGQTPSWTISFVGSFESYSFPASPSQARLRVHENVKRYARNYASLFIVFLACSLYQMPLALVGLISCLALWDLFKYFSDQWTLDQYPVLKQILFRFIQCATAVILLLSNVQMALLFALGVSYIVMLLHASFRKLTPVKQPQCDGNRRTSRK